MSIYSVRPVMLGNQRGRRTVTQGPAQPVAWIVGYPEGSPEAEFP